MLRKITYCLDIFSDWTVQTGYLYRTVGVLHAPLGDKNITHMFKQDFIRNISYPLYGKDDENVFELIHNRVHHWIGGEMKSIETAADDPIFHPYHSFVSLVWEEFRSLQRQKGIDPETDWDDYYGQGRHHRYSPMGLGNLMAGDGASNVFAENIVFAKRPSCTKENIDCGTPFLYCNVTVEKCCPWTLQEYHIIKDKSVETNATLKYVIQPYIQSKLKKGFLELEDKGFVLSDVALKYLGDDIDDMFKELKSVERPNESEPVETHVVNWDNVFAEHENHHENGNVDELGYESENMEESEHSDNDPPHDDHKHIHAEHEVTHSEHEHTLDEHEQIHNRPIIEGPGTIRKTPFDLFMEEYGILIIAGLMLFRVLFAICAKCRTDACPCGSRKQKYHMDGIVNINFNEEDNISKRADTNTLDNRQDNVYTITITANGQGTLGKTTFVRFAKFGCDEAKKTGDEVVVNANHKTNCNYMDMSQAITCLEVSVDSSELFEREPATTEDDESDDYDASYNSIENENFDFIRAAIKEAGEEYDDDGDIFDTYDNCLFEREQPIACNGIEEGEVGMESGKHRPDEGYVDYLPGTHM